MSAINGATCNAAVTSGCVKAPPTITVGKAPAGVAVDQATDTVYVANAGGTTVSVINGGTCNGTVTSGCGQTPPQVHLKNPPWAVAVDQATDTIYAVNTIDNTVSVINGATCNRRITSGCSDKPAAVHVGRQGFGFAAVDPAADLIYVTNYLDDTVSVINGATCNGNIASGCDQTPRPFPQAETRPGSSSTRPATPSTSRTTASARCPSSASRSQAAPPG